MKTSLPGLRRFYRIAYGLFLALAAYQALLRDDPTEVGVERLLEKAQPGERIEIGGRALHLFVGADGVSGTTLTNPLVEKALGTTSTWRNPTVVAALVEKWC